MTRRSFLTDMLKCGIATTFLPGAGRIWKPTYTPTCELISFSVMRENANPLTGSLNLQELFKICYDLKRKREAIGNAHVIERIVERSFFDTTPPAVEFSDEGLPVKGVYQQMIEV